MKYLLIKVFINQRFNICMKYYFINIFTNKILNIHEISIKSNIYKSRFNIYMKYLFLIYLQVLS